MPYIDDDRRSSIFIRKEQGNAFDCIDINEIDSAGEIQYAIAVILKDYMKRKGLKYQNCNDIMGALAGAQQEFYRQTVAPYEDLKIKENGNV